MVGADIQVEIEPVEFDDMANRAPAESSATIRARVMGAREIQQTRFKDILGIHCNAQMSGKQIRHIAEAIGYRALDRPSNFAIAF